MWEPGRRASAADELGDMPDEGLDEAPELEEALTLAAAAPGRRRLERLEELLLVRAAQASDR